MAIEIGELAAMIVEALAPELAQSILERLFPGGQLSSASADQVAAVAAHLDIMDQHLGVLGDAEHADTARIDSDLSLARAEILNAIGSIPVSTTAPPWYTAPSAGSTPADIWAYQDPYKLFNYGDYLSAAGDLAFNLDQSGGVLHGQNPLFTLSGRIGSEYSGDIGCFTPHPDWADIGPTETLLAWLQRTDTDLTWTADSYSGTPVAPAGGSAMSFRYVKIRPAFSEAQWKTWRDNGVLAAVGGVATAVGGVRTVVDAINANFPLDIPPPVLSLPPVLDTTLYTRSYQSEIAFSAPFVHNVACDGLIYTLGTHGARVKAFDVEDYTVLTGAGVLLFLDNDGNPEPYQFMNADRGVVMPRAMAHASGFIWSSNVALSGTVTPFTLVPVT